MLSIGLPGPGRGVFMLYIALIASLFSQAHGLSITYCSPDNNAGSYPRYYSQYMSNGLCHDHCQGSYAFAILQGSYCWCSNYVPTDQQSTYDCNEQCPGYPSDWCGSTEAGLYGYYELSPGAPLGTSGGSASNTAPQTSSSVSTSPVESGSPSTSTSNARATFSSSASSSSSVVTVGSSQSSDEATSVTYDTSSTPLTSSSSSIPSSPSTSPSSSDATTADPATESTTSAPTEVYTSVTTVTGKITTILVTPTPAVSSDATLGQSATGGGGGGISSGKVAGIVVGAALGVGALIGAGMYIWYRRRQARNSNNSQPESSFIARSGDQSPSNNVPSRQVSQLSSSGLLGTKTPRINTSGIPNGNGPRSAGTGSSGIDRRSLATDQRLNPYALYFHDEGHVSNVSLQDNQDYSRQLRVANPDP
ncbi:hypothetical protein PV08_04527 [Exophiala spinifera]|uniref:WSC domain-containing protein n=1 Tax=Exophiala spinifera TaxID=91928 RepID=A0A0D2BFE4_9EURO|nr:uncharacterized protein PV08_04527 [Exophiala spinifera]KIW17335.1 hypothetical protein PV08_04527 [Exophiala spinifera]